MKSYDKGDAPYITCKHETYNFTTEVWALANPDAGFPKLTIIDSKDEVKVDAVIMSSTELGKFEHQCIIALDAEGGWWRGYIYVENAGYPTTEPFSFYVK